MTKSSPRPQIFVSFENFAIFNTASIWYQLWKDSMQIINKNEFHNDDVTNDVTEWRQTRPSIIMLIEIVTF